MRTGIQRCLLHEPLAARAYRQSFLSQKLNACWYIILRTDPLSHAGPHCRHLALTIRPNIGFTVMNRSFMLSIQILGE